MFNNAGVAVTSSVLDADPGDDEWLRQINFDGVVNGTRAFLPILVEQDDGVIVNTSSVFGLLGMPYQSAYCASKFAVRGFTDALRQELRGTGVSAVTVHPGGITTNIARNARIRKDPEGRGRSHEQMTADFEAITMTTPDKAAEIICRGIERGKARILVGPDAYAFDALARVAPTTTTTSSRGSRSGSGPGRRRADERARRRPDRRDRAVRDWRRPSHPAATGHVTAGRHCRGTLAGAQSWPCSAQKFRHAGDEISRVVQPRVMADSGLDDELSVREQPANSAAAIGVMIQSRSPASSSTGAST